MPLTTFDEIRDNIASTIRDTQITSLLGTFINLTLQEIHDFHPWSWKRRKTTFSTVANQEDYNLDEEVDGIAFLRMRETPRKLIYVPDRIFYAGDPDPESDTGTPEFYRLWEETGFSAQLTADGTIQVLSDNANDGATFAVRVVGQNSSGDVVAETMTLNGTTVVTGTTTWEAGKLFQVSKSAQTTGTLTVRATVGSSTLARLAPEDLAPRYKRLSLYPIPTSVITMYLEYYERLRLLVHDADVPQMDKKWTWVLREGALAKTWEYKQNEAAAAQHFGIFRDALRTMRSQDERNMDYVPVLRPRRIAVSTIRRLSDSVNDNYPSYSVGY